MYHTTKRYTDGENEWTYRPKVELCETFCNIRRIWFLGNTLES